jgi:N-acetylglutamate synthase-like GNAT family acetyltransferase
MADIQIRKATKQDSGQIMRIISALDLYIPDTTYKGFWLALKKNKIIGLARLANHGDFLFLTSAGVIETERKKGIAAMLLQTILKNADRDVYLYTIIPEFFEKFGFKITRETEKIPTRESFGCDRCTPEKCVCMVRKGLVISDW